MVKSEEIMAFIITNKDRPSKYTPEINVEVEDVCN